jgi:hypothetical protein
MNFNNFNQVGGSDSGEFEGFGFGGFGGPVKEKPDLRIKKFKEIDITYIKLINRWTNENHCSTVYQHRFKRGPIFPLFYRDTKEYEIIEFHEYKDKEGNIIAEKGAYDKDTGALVLGVRIIVQSILNDPENDPKNISYKEFCEVGEFKGGDFNGGGKLHGLGRKYNADTW